MHADMLRAWPIFYEHHSGESRGSEEVLSRGCAVCLEGAENPHFGAYFCKVLPLEWGAVRKRRRRQCWSLVVEGKDELPVMKRKRSMVIGLACGVLCALCVGAYVMQVDEQASAVRAEALARYGGEQIEVCVAKRDIAAGETIADSAVETKMWVAALLPEGAITNRNDAVGKTVGTSVLKGEVLLARRFDAQTNPIDVPEGFTAVSVPARDVQAIGGALAAGMKTDVYAIGASSAERILTQATVLATSASDAGTGASSASITWVTLAVAPQKVQEVIAAAENLDLYFVLPAEAKSSAEKTVGKSDEKTDGQGAEATNDEDAGLSAALLNKSMTAEQREEEEEDSPWMK